MNEEVIDSQTTVVLEKASTEEGLMVDYVTETDDVEFDIHKQAQESQYYQYGNLTIECSCGNKEVIEYAIKEGIQVILRTTDTDVFGLKCSKCNHTLSLKFEQSSIEEVGNKYGFDEQVSEECEADEVSVGIPTDNELSVEVNS